MRRADDAQDFSSRSLLLQRFPQFMPQYVEAIRARSGKTIAAWNFSNSTALRRDALMAPRFGRFGPDSLAWLHCSPDETPRNIAYCSMVLGSWELSVSENPSAIPTTRMSSPLFPEGPQTGPNVQRR